MKGTLVTIEVNGTTYTGTTAKDGLIALDVNWHNLVAPVKVTATKSGWKKLAFEMGLNDHRKLTGDIPVMEQKAEESSGAGVVLALIALVPPLVLIGRRRVA